MCAGFGRPKTHFILANVLFLSLNQGQMTTMRGINLKFLSNHGISEFIMSPNNQPRAHLRLLLLLQCLDSQEIQNLVLLWIYKLIEHMPVLQTRRIKSEGGRVITISSA